MGHVDLVDSQAQALCAAHARRQLPPKHRLYAIRILVELVVLSIGFFRVRLPPLPPLLVALRAAVQQRPREELAHILASYLARSRAQKPPADVVLGVRDLIPASPEKLLPLLLLEGRRVLCIGLKRALAGQVDKQPEGSLYDAPREEEATEGRVRGLCDAEGDPEDAEGRDGAESEDARPDEQVLGERVFDHGGCATGY